MTRSQAEHWSIARSLAFLAATFAIVFGTLMPFGAMAAARPGEPLIICSSEGPQVIQVGGDVDGPGGKAHPAKCAACVMPLPAVTPSPPLLEPGRPLAITPTDAWTPLAAAPTPPARAPPRPPSTAPPLA